MMIKFDEMTERGGCRHQGDGGESKESGIAIKDPKDLYDLPARLALPA